VTLAGLLALACAIPSGALAQVGRRNFYDPMITEDPNPCNEIEIDPGWVKESGRSSASFSFSLEKQLSDTFGLEISDAINDLSRRRFHSGTGIDNVELLATWAFYTNVEHEFRIALGFDSLLPTGDIDSGAESHARGGPMLTFARGLGDLPDRDYFRLLRPIAIQSDAAYLPAWSGHESQIVEFNVAISYSMTYLTESGIGLPWERFSTNLVPFTEINYQQVAFGKYTSSPPDWRVTPGLAYLTQYYQLSVATQLALNNVARTQDHSSVLIQLSIYYDQIWPAAGWQPF
jgi:hypothetical protein